MEDLITEAARKPGRPKGVHVAEIDDAPSQAIPTAAAPAPQAVSVVGNNSDETLSGERITVLFHTQEGDLGKLPVEVGLNGVVYRMPRNVPCHIPVEVLGVIDNAVQEVYEATGTSVTKSIRPRFSYQLVL